MQASDVVITSYDIATRDVETLQLVHWDRLLLDEAQDVKNPQTRRARSLRLLRARRRVAMTGTPIENHLGELWAIMDLLNPGLLGSREWFHRAFIEPIQIDDDPEALERLRAIVRPFILRRRKDDPEVELDLPPITMLKDYCLLTRSRRCSTSRSSTRGCRASRRTRTASGVAARCSRCSAS